MHTTLSKTKAFLDGKHWSDLLEDTNEAAAKSSIHRKLEEDKALENEADLQYAYDTYRLVKTYCKRIFTFRKHLNETLEGEKKNVGKTFKEDVAGVMDNVKKNWNSLSGKEKLAVAAGGLITAAMILTSENPRMERLKEVAITCCKIAGVAWLGNKVCKVFMGETAIDAINEWSSETVASSDFWKRAFHTESEKAEALRKATIFVGDIDFMRIAGEYKKAKDLGKDKIDLPTVSSKDMKPEDIFTAMKVLDSKYPVDQLMQKYALAKPPKPTFQEVVAAEMIEDKTIEMDDSLPSRVGAQVKGAYTRATNYIVPKVEAAGDYIANGKLEEKLATGGEKVGTFLGKTGRGIGVGFKGLAVGAAAGVGGLAKGGYEGVKAVGKEALAGAKEVGGDLKEAGGETWEWVKSLYYENFGRLDTDEKMLEWDKERMRVWVESSQKDLDTTIRQKVPDQEKAQGYIDAGKKGQPEKFNDIVIRFIERNGAVFVAADETVQNTTTVTKEMIKAPKKSYEGAVAFLQNKYNIPADKIKDMIDMPYLGMHIQDTGVDRVYMRMALPGTPEYNQRLSGGWVPNRLRGLKEEILFNEGNKLDVTKLDDWQKNLLRVRFYLDASQTKELAEICNWYNQHYLGRGMPHRLVIGAIFEKEDKKRDDTLRSDLRFAPKLVEKRDLLDTHESEIANIEEKAASKIKGSFAAKQEFETTVRRVWGYRLRLAILGDRASMDLYDYDPASTDKTKIRNIKDLLATYNHKLEKEAELKNAGN